MCGKKVEAASPWDGWGQLALQNNKKKDKIIVMIFIYYNEGATMAIKRVQWRSDLCGRWKYATIIMNITGISTYLSIPCSMSSGENRIPPMLYFAPELPVKNAVRAAGVSSGGPSTLRTWWNRTKQNAQILKLHYEGAHKHICMHKCMQLYAHKHVPVGMDYQGIIEVDEEWQSLWYW